MCAFLAVDFTTALMRLSGGSLAGLFRSEHLSRLLGGPLVIAVVLFLLWNYWLGENWARLAVLVWSALIAVEEVSTIAEHNGGLMAAMSHPLSFLKFALAVFLLYWLNTRPVRAFFRGAPSAMEHLNHQLAGRLCTAVAQDASATATVWQISFEHDGLLTLHCPWRIVVDDNLAFATNAAGEADPNPAPAQTTPLGLLPNLRVKSVRIKPRTTDLFIAFEMGIEVQTWSADPKREQWSFSDPMLTVVADAVGVKSRAMPAQAATEDPAEN
jgi:hypothetical protein